MKQLVVVVSGRKQAGKSTLSNYIKAKYLNYRLNMQPNHGQFYIDDRGELKLKLSTGNGGFQTLNNSEMASFIEPDNGASVKVYSFADPLKAFCIDVLGVPYEGCWGTDEQKNAKIPHLLWENIPKSIRPSYDVYHEPKYKEFSGESEQIRSTREYKSGPMTAREVMQVFGTDICRRLYGDCWARGTYNQIKKEGVELALVADARFPNEVTIGKEVAAKTIRLGRILSNDNHPSETALDSFPKENYTLYVDNSNFTIAEQCAFIDPYIDLWFKEAGIR